MNRKKKKPETINIEDATVINETKNKDMEKEQEKNNQTDSQLFNQEVKKEALDPIIDSEPIVPDYAKMQVEGDISFEPIPEEVIERPTINFNEPESINIESDDKIRGSSKEPSNKPNEPKKQPIGGNPDLDEKTLKEKRKAASFSADTILDGYEMLWKGIGTYLTIDENTIIKKAVKGKLELEVLDSELDLGGGTIIPIRKMMKEYNEAVEESTIVTKEFKEEAKPLIEEEMRIRNWGMTNTQRLMAMAFKDIQPRATKIFQVHSIFNMVLKQQSEMIKQYKMQNQQQENATRPIIINDIQEPDERS
jgi:hypothetical protein